jgi:hypothetical protein
MRYLRRFINGEEIMSHDNPKSEASEPGPIAKAVAKRFDALEKELRDLIKDAERRLRELLAKSLGGSSDRPAPSKPDNVP